MRKLSANLIIPVSSPPLKNGIITLDDNGRILDLVDTGGNLREERGLEFYNGVIVPGFVIPWFVPGDIPLEKLDKLLLRHGIKGIGLVLSVDKVSDVGFKSMSTSPIIYHPVIELCPTPDQEHFEVFNRGIDIVTHAFNTYNLPCSLTACSPAMNGDMGKLLAEYSSSHENVSAPAEIPDNPDQILNIPEQILNSPEQILNILPRMQHPLKGIEKMISAFTLDAAAEIFEEDVLGSIEPGKYPGLNLVSGLKTNELLVGEKTVLKVLD
ncbi:hypothetical protein ACFLTA_09090 [Bacteroidota bacterium]